jgi:hypothetical protein
LRVLWYSFTPVVTSSFTAKVSDYSWQAGLALFSGSCGSLLCYAAESYCYAVVSEDPFIGYYCDFDITWTGYAGTTYYLAVSGDSDFNDIGSYSLTITVRLTSFTVDKNCWKITN